MNALPIIVVVLCVMAIAYRYYSAFIAAKVLALDDSRAVPSQTMFDGHNYYPTNKWVLFGHHFAAISGAGPLIGPVLAAQFGFLPGLLWLVIGVCLGGAVHDFMILAARIRRQGKSLAEIARTEISGVSGFVAGIAILFIVIIALAGLGLVVVNAWPSHHGEHSRSASPFRSRCSWGFTCIAFGKERLPKRRSLGS
jgi:carbon starvation protein